MEITVSPVVHSPVYYKRLEYVGETVTKESMKSRGIVAYLCVAFLGAWSLWLAGWIVASRLFQISASNPLFQVMVLPGAFMPAIAAVVTRRWVTREGFSDVGSHLNFRRCWRYYLFGGYVLPIIVVGVIVALAILLGISQPDFSLHRSLAVLIPKAHSAFPRITPSLWAILIFQMMIVGVPLGTIVTWGEEFGWRGYLQLRLFAAQPILAAVVTGVIWGVWHYPLILFGYEHYENVWAGLLVFPVCTVMLSIIFGWLRLKTDSVWSSCIAHGATNALGVSITLLLFLGGPHFLYVSYLGIPSWVPLGAICVWIRPKLVNARKDRICG